MHLPHVKDLDISLKLGLFLASVALITIISFSGVLYFASIQKDDAAVVDAAGRNRMLSQRIAFLSERLQKGQRVGEDLMKAVNLLNTSLYAIRNGGIAPGIAGDRELPPTPEKILPVFGEAEAMWLAYKEKVHIILEAGMSAGDSAAAAGAMTYIESNAGPMLGKFNELVSYYVADAEGKQRNLKIFLIVLSTFNVAIVAFAFFVINRYVAKPVNMISTASSLLAEGNLGYKVRYEAKDEIGTAVTNMGKLVQNLEQAVTFAENIGRGSYDTELKSAGKNDQLTEALITMRDKLLAVQKEDRHRNWAAEGLTMFADITRSASNVAKMYEDIISKLVQYMGANQGMIFIVNDDRGTDPYLELQATYAWNKVRFQEKRIQPGQGLAGQVWLEKEMIYLREVPDNYVRITSGLGEAKPKFLIVVPLSVDDKVFGIIELASFREFEAFELEFIKKLSELLGSTVSMARANEQTRRLLEQSQQQAEELRAQEEEMRQNMEELQATQEEVVRKEREYLRRIAELEDRSMNIMNLN